MNFKKFMTYVKIHWIKIVLTVVILALVIFSAIFLTYCIKNFFSLESFSRKQISGQMALLLPMFVIVHLISMPMMMAMQFYFMQGGGIGKVYIEKAKVSVKWDEVIGLENAKREAWELVKLLKDRALLKSVGGKIIKGTMMIGPPGCGKTYLAKAIASECGLPLLPTVGSEFVGMFVGQGTARMKSLFSQARALAKLEGGCIVFIDEIDSFARPRGADTGFGGGRMDMNSTINQFLTEMDGLRNTENNIVVIAATNVPENELDSAIMRAGRFDRKINVTKPNLKEREAIFKLYLSRISTDSSINPNILARKTVWFSPAEIESMVRESSLIGMREGRSAVNMNDLNAAYDRVSFGQASNIVMSDDEKHSTAYHETGHALLYYLVHPTDDVMKATIIPRAGALGYVFARPTEELHCKDSAHLLAEIKVSIASYVVEKRKFGTTTTGVGGGRGSDFHKAIQIAHNMVWSYGMGGSGLIGDFNALGANNLSERTKETLDSDIQELLQSCLRDVESLVETNWAAVEAFAAALHKKEELDYDEIEAIFSSFGLKPLPKGKSL
ncbi:MAG: AAA family ATPase [Candidatus Omnitrophica bacterium]|nr:AAA family ATPase [Candidatus Omnitrophota bacterium]MBU1997026.1 AAA family ATPase [Candidatus Omnitrophota bacterium]MBU4333284.1 AAA family ATPase [Candidatus Omnitrophota bacterium]